MSFAEEFLPEFEDEMASLRRLLELVPADRLDWKPHPKSRTMGELATHLSELPRWGMRFGKETWQIGSEKPPAMKSAPEFLARFDENVSGSRGPQPNLFESKSRMFQVARSREASLLRARKG